MISEIKVSVGWVPPGGSRGRICPMPLPALRGRLVKSVNPSALPLAPQSHCFPFSFCLSVLPSPQIHQPLYLGPSINPGWYHLRSFSDYICKILFPSMSNSEMPDVSFFGALNPLQSALYLKIHIHLTAKCFHPIPTSGNREMDTERWT